MNERLPIAVVLLVLLAGCPGWQADTSSDEDQVEVSNVAADHHTIVVGVWMNGTRVVADDEPLAPGEEQEYSIPEGPARYRTLVTVDGDHTVERRINITSSETSSEVRRINVVARGPRNVSVEYLTGKEAA